MKLSGVWDAAKEVQEMFPRMVTANSITRIDRPTVPYINALGIILRGFFVSSAKKVTLYQPKKVSEMKKTVRKIVGIGLLRMGVNLEMSIKKTLGNIIIKIIVMVIRANPIIIVELDSIPK